MKVFKHLLILTLGLTLFASCNNGESLQRYFVDNSENTDFIAVDLPVSLLEIVEEDLSPEEKGAYKSLKKLNVLAFRLEDNNKVTYEAEKVRVKEILKNPKYQDLMKFNSGSTRATVKFLGDDDAIDEVIIFGTDSKYGFALVRVLGNKMKPEGVSQLLSVLQQSNFEDKGLEKLNGFFGR